MEASAAARVLSRSLPVARELAASDIVGDAGTVVDVAGGTGTLVAEILRRHLSSTGVLVERPGMLTHARTYLAAQKVAERCRLVEGDFLTSLPAGGDVYLLKSVLHDWDDERCLAILRTCRVAMDQAARLLIVELVLPEIMTPSPPKLSAALLDLIMLAYAGGHERTEQEFMQLLDQAGLRLASTHPLSTGPQVLEALLGESPRSTTGQESPAAGVGPLTSAPSGSGVGSCPPMSMRNGG